MHLFNLCLFLAAGSNDEDAKNVALDLIMAGIKSFHMSKNNDYIIVFGYEGKDWSAPFANIKGVSSVFMEPRNNNHKENSQALIKEFVEKGQLNIVEPKILKTTKEVIDTIPELKEMYERKHLHNVLEPLRFGLKEGQREKTLAAREKGLHDTRNEVGVITPEIWKDHFAEYAQKHDLRGTCTQTTHPRIAFNTYLVYLNTKSWVLTADIVRGMPQVYSSCPSARNSIQRWFEEGTLDGLLEIYKSLAFEE